MKKHIFDLSGKHLIKIVEAEPICGEDFCELCGGCLACYGGEMCAHGDEHFWVVYEDD